MLPLLIQGMYEHIEYERNGSRRRVADNRPETHVSIGEMVKAESGVSTRDVGQKQD